MKYTAVHTICDSSLEETLSFLFQELGYEGTSYEKGRLIAYCKSELFNKQEVDQLLQNFGVISEQILEIEEQNWNATWEENFKEALMGEHIQVRAPFHQTKGLKHDIIISPKMAFGTGHHETTRLSGISLEKLDCTSKAVLDMGCGSGVLAILASQKGAKQVVAIDYDPNCIENTTENVQLNNTKNVQIIRADTLEHLHINFDIIVSNIVKNINLRLLPEFIKRMNPGATLILCGFLEDDLEEQEKAALAHGLKLTEKNTDNNWLQTRYILA
ncbi:MAG: 50S ribosomal protein L11 methyltransferase [Bacteroidetes bacterium]|jgi:ribosomal protein L11 methyltransferase|nr:50S ribosomal protein L11 methyltransferase [Bacteroidota bacterium]